MQPKNLIARVSTLFVLFVLLAAAVAPMAPAATCQVTTYYVSVAGDDDNSGTSPDQPLRNIQTAVTAAPSGSEILITGGVYTSTQTNAVIEEGTGKALTFRGSYSSDFSSRDHENNPTVLDGEKELIGSTYYGRRGCYFTGSGSYTLDQIDIAHGYTESGSQGGGVFAVGAGIGLIIANAKVENCLSDHQGGWLYMAGTLDQPASLTINGCSITGNHGGWHGHTEFSFTNFTVKDTVFGGNSCWWGGFTPNKSTGSLYNVVFKGNASAEGEGMKINQSSVDLFHITFNNNDGSNGEAILVSNDSTVRGYNLIVANQARGINGGTGADVVLDHTLWHNVQVTSTIAIISLDELLADPLFEIDGYHIQAGSPAQNAGLNMGVIADIDGDVRDAQPDIGVDENLTASCQPVASATVSGPTSGLVGEVLNYVGTYGPANATQPVMETWDNSMTGSSSSYTFNTEGTYTVWYTATNECGQAVDSLEVVITDPCVEVAEVELSYLGGAICPGGTVQFEATISPSNFSEYNVLVLVNGEAGMPSQSSANPLQFTESFADPGEHTVQIKVWNCSMTEADAATDTVNITVLEPPTVEISGPASGQVGQELVYTANTGGVVTSLTWDNGDAGATSTRTYGSAGDYTIAITATGPCGQVTDSTMVSISALPTVGWSDSTYYISEFVDQTTQTMVVLSAASAQTVTVEYATLDGTAIAGEDYVATSGTLVFNPGQTSKDVNIQLINDAIGEGDESFGIVLSNPTGAELDISTCTVVIVDDEGPCTQVTGVTLSHEGDTVPANSVVNFTAVIAPVNASMPATMVVVVDGEEQTPTQVNQNTVEFTLVFATSGQHTVEVKVKNCSMTQWVTDTDTVTAAYMLYLPLVIRNR